MHAKLCPLPLGLAVADKAMFNFCNQWLAGLQPQLVLETGPDGKILVSSRVVAGDVPTHANLVLRHPHAEQVEAEDRVNPHRQAGEAGHRRRRPGPCQQRRRLRREAARAAAAVETADKAVENNEPAVEAADKAGKVFSSSAAGKVAQTPTHPTQVDAAEAGLPFHHPSHLQHDQNFRSAPPDATARCVPPGSQPHPPQPKYTSYMDKEKQRWTSLFGD